MLSNTITFLLIFIFGLNALATNSEVIRMAEDTKIQVKASSSFEGRRQAIEELRTKLMERAMSLAEEKDRMSDELERLEKNLAATPKNSVAYAANKREFDRYSKQFNKFSRNYYAYYELYNFLSLIPPFSGQPTTKPKSCEEAVRDIRYVTPKIDENDITQTDTLKDLRYQAIQIGRLLYECTEEKN